MKKIILSLLMIVSLIVLTGCGNKNNKEDNKSFIVGKWNTTFAVNANDAKKETNLKNIFGSSYSQYGSYIEFKEDGTFLEAIYPITKGDKSHYGTYEVINNYYKEGDCFIILKYDDNRELKLQKAKLDDTDTIYLVVDDIINDYQFALKK